MQFYPNQRPRLDAFDKMKHLNDQVLRDHRLQGAREAARRLRRVVDEAASKVRGLVHGLERFEHAQHHVAHEDHQLMEGADNLDEIAHQLERVALETHTEIQHSPSSHLPEFQQGAPGGVDGGLFQLVGILIVLMKRIRLLRPHARPEARRAGLEAKRLLEGVRAAARKR